MTKLVNLDELAAVERSVKYKGKSYPIEDLSILDFVIAQKTADAVNQALTNNDMPGVVTAAQEIVKLAAPKFPVDQIGKMNHKQIIALISVIFDQYPDVAEEAKAAAPAGDAGGDAGNV